MKGEEWAQGERWDWSARDQRARADRAAATTTASARIRDPTTPAASLVVRGDRRLRRRRRRTTPEPAPAAGRRRAAARGRHRRRAAVLTTGDNIYAGSEAARHPDRRHRRRRRRLVLHLLPAVPLRPQPHSGVSVDRQSRRGRNRGARRPRAGRGQLLPARAHRRRRGGGPRVVRSGAVLPVPLRLRHRVRLHRHVEGELLQGPPAVRVPEALGRSSSSRFRRTPRGAMWRIPFAHHPPYSAGPQHHNTQGDGRSCCRCSSAPA